MFDETNNFLDENLPWIVWKTTTRKVIQIMIAFHFVLSHVVLVTSGKFGFTRVEEIRDIKNNKTDKVYVNSSIIKTFTLVLLRSVFPKVCSCAH